MSNEQDREALALIRGHIERLVVLLSDAPHLSGLAPLLVETAALTACYEGREDTVRGILGG